jgi:hypothetical protein
MMRLVLRLDICSAITDYAVYRDAIGIAIDYPMRLLLLFVMMRLVLRLAICSAITAVDVYWDAIGINIVYAMQLLLL